MTEPHPFAKFMTEEPDWDAPALPRTPLVAGDAAEPQFKTSPKPRAKAKARPTAADRKAASATAWIEAHPAAWAWIVGAAPRFGFAASMMTAVAQWGGLTDNQHATVERLMKQDAERNAARAVERAERIATAPVVSIAAIETAFGKAQENGVRFPRLPLTWVNPENKDDASTFLFKASAKGPIYVTERDAYLGKITEGRFFRVAATTGEQERRIVDICADPKQAAVAYGRRFGACCKCGRELTNPASIEAGIGPICAEKFGW